MNLLPCTAPVVSVEENARWEKKLFAGDEAAEWTAMQRAGEAVAVAVLRDFSETGPWPDAARILVLVGKGHNGGDALIAARSLLQKFPHARADLLFIFGALTLRPLARRAHQDLVQAGGDRVTLLRAIDEAALYEVALDGIFGFQFRPPLPQAVSAILKRVNAATVRLRAAVDLPSGLAEADAFRADFTYATGSIKAPLLDLASAGRVRFLDLGFFPDGALPRASDRVLTTRLLEPLARLRPMHSDKRTYGHIFVVGGSRGYPGAVLMCVLSALRSGAGLVTAFAPASLVPAYAARAPEAMWVAWPEGPEGNLSPAGEHLIRERWKRATALVIGPGLGRAADTLAAVEELVGDSPVPVVLDADALQPALVAACKGTLIVTPHAGEFARLAGDTGLREYARKRGRVVTLKGPTTRVCAGGCIYHSFFGGPVLARGGSGDLLSGLTGGLLAQTPDDPLLAAARAVVWHGAAANFLARQHGQTSVQVTQLLDFLPIALREWANEP